MPVNTLKNNQSVFSSSINGPKIEIMPSGVPQSFYMEPSKYHDAQLRAALVELKITLQKLTQQPMNSDATSLIEIAAHEIRKNRAILNKNNGNNTASSMIHNTQFGVTISGTSPPISMSTETVNTPELKYSPLNGIGDSDSQDISIDNIDWDF